jgi:1-phosphofructokinase family hexose kinase
MRQIHTITLNPVIDLIYEVDEYQKGTTFRSDTFQLIPAGKGVNVSYALAGMNEESAAYVAVGWKESDISADACRERGVDYRPYPGVFQTRRHCTILEKNSRSTTHVQIKGQIVPLSPFREMIGDLAKQVQEGDWVVLSGSIPPGVPSDIYAEMIQKCQERGAKTLLDASGDPLRAGVEAGPDLLKVNQTEAQQLTQSPIQTQDDAIAAVKAIYQRTHIPFIALSMGKEGLIAGMQGDVLRLFVPLDEKDVRDTVGCGDAMVAGMLYGLNHGFDPEAMFRYGIACASAAALQVGPGHFEWSDMESMLKMAQITEVESL